MSSCASAGEFRRRSRRCAIDVRPRAVAAAGGRGGATRVIATARRQRQQARDRQGARRSSRAVSPVRGRAARGLDRSRIRRSRLGGAVARAVRAAAAAAARERAAARRRDPVRRDPGPAAPAPRALRGRRGARAPASSSCASLTTMRSSPTSTAAKSRGAGSRRSGRQAAAPHGPEVERVYVAGPATPSRCGRRQSPGGRDLSVSGPQPGDPDRARRAVGLAAASGVRIVRGPYLAAPSEAHDKTRMNVVWETDLPATGKVVVERGGRDATARPAARAADPRARRPPGRSSRSTRSSAGRRYRYRVEVEAAPGDKAASAPVRFETLPAPPAPLRFAVYGDMRYPGHEAHRAVVEALMREAPPLVINTGDLTDVGSEESNWQRYFDVTAPLGAIAPVIPVLGNHDAARGGAGALEDLGSCSTCRTPAPPFYTSLDLGGVHFVVARHQRRRRRPARLAGRRSGARAAPPRARCLRVLPRGALVARPARRLAPHGPRLRAAAGGGARRRAVLRARPHLRARRRPDADGQAHLRRHRRRRRAALQPALPGGVRPAGRRRSRAAAALSAAVAALTKTYHYVMVTVADRRDPALPEAAGRLSGRAVRQACRPIDGEPRFRLLMRDAAHRRLRRPVKPTSTAAATCSRGTTSGWRSTQRPAAA